MDPKILIVESETPSSSRVVRTLRTAGFRVVAPASPATSLATFERIRPDLVLVGNSLPDDGGVALCREIKKTPHGARTPVALLLDHVEIDLPPLQELGWDRLIESATGDQELVAICRELIQTRGAPMFAPPAPPAASDSGTVSGEAGGSGAEQRSLEDAIDQVLTFEHEESVAHLQRSAAEPDTVGPSAESTGAVAHAPTAAATPEAPAAPAPAARPEQPRYQTAALVEPEPQEQEETHQEIATPQVVPVRRWWLGGAIAGAAILIAVVAWLGFSGGPSDAPAPVAAAGSGNFTEIILPSPIALGSQDAPAPSSTDPTTVAASFGAPWTEPASEDSLFPAAPTPGESEPPAVTKPSTPTAQPKATVNKPKPPAVKKELPEPKPAIVKTPPVAKSTPLEPEPAIVKTTPVVTEPEPPVAKSAPPEPEPAAVETPPAVTEPEPEPAVVNSPPEPAEPRAVPEETAVDEPLVAVVTEPAPPVPPAPAPLVDPVLLDRVEPAPSPKALKRHRGATIVLKLLINEQGNVIRVVVVQGIPGSEIEAATVNAVLRWRYRPATRGGDAVQAWIEERFTFR